jgi:CubicO group peptidase (beta-lactamase class C family)
MNRSPLFPRLARTAAVCAPLLALAASPAPAQGADPLAGFDAYVEEARRAWHVPGLAVAVVHGDSTVFAKGFGTRTVGLGQPVDEHTLFAVASTTKAFTVAALSILADEGKLSWDDPVRKHLPGFELGDAYVTRELTLRDLLTHRSGVAADDYLWVLGYPRGEILRRMRHLPQATSLRSAYAYNNNMYVVAGEVVSAVSGMPWERFVAERILAPLGMRETTPGVAGVADRTNVATPHYRLRDTTVVVPYRDRDNAGPAGSMMSSVHDMARWVRFHLDSARVDGTRLVSARQRAEWWTPQFTVPASSFYPAAARAGAQFPSYGLGWFLASYRGHVVAMHTGSIDGMSAIVGLIPELDVGLVVLANLDHAEVRHALMYRVFDAYIGGRDPVDWSRELQPVYAGGEAAARAARARLDSARVRGTRPSLPLARYAGVYADTLYGDLRVELVGHNLIVSIGPGGLVGDLTHWNYDTFLVRWREVGSTDNLLTFGVDARGRAATATVQGMRTFRRVPEAPPQR